MAEYVKVWWTVAQTPEEHYWDENFRALVEDDGRWFPQESVTAEHRRALDRALLLGVPDGDV